MKQWTRFKFHVSKVSPIFLTQSQIAYYFSLCEHEYEQKIVLNTLERKLLQCKKLLRLDEDIGYMKEEEKKICLSTTIKTDYEAIFRRFEQPMSGEEENFVFDLVTRGDLAALRHLLASDFKLKLKFNTLVDAHNQTALLVAVKLNNYELSEFLVRLKSIRLDHCDNGGWTALRYSAWLGNERIVCLLLENGASVDVSDLEGRTALRAAVFSGHESIVKLLIRHGADGKCLLFCV